MSEEKRVPKCPICRSEAPLRADGNEFFPFCSSRCQLNDLGNWLDEVYVLPIGQDATERSLPEIPTEPTEFN